MEYITANGTEYACQNISTGINMISFTVANGDIGALSTAFKSVTDLTVSGEDKVVYGTYSGLAFKNATVDAESSVTVSMSIATDVEKKLAELAESQEAQNAAIDDLASAVGGN